MIIHSGTVKDLRCSKCGAGIVAGVAYIEHGGRIEHAFGCPVETENKAWTERSRERYEGHLEKHWTKDGERIPQPGVFDRMFAGRAGGGKPAGYKIPFQVVAAQTLEESMNGG